MGLERPRADEGDQVVVVDRLLLEEELGHELDLIACIDAIRRDSIYSVPRFTPRSVT